MLKIRPAILIPLIAIPAATMAVLLIDGTAFEADPPDLPDSPCPTTSAVKQGRYPTDYTDSAQSYTGRGPHLVATDVPLVEAGLPARWKTKAGQESRHTSALVLCQYQKDTNDPVDECRYVGDVSVTLTRSRATYRLYEAKTSELVGSFRIDGASSCPYSFRYPEGSPPPRAIPQTVDTADVIAKLRPYVERSRHAKPGLRRAG